jgi:GNAT superfamily N-acetyltransferase
MDDSRLFDRMRASMRAFYRLIAAGSRESSVIERQGLTAAVVPATPERSVCNGVVFERPQDLPGTLDQLADAYERAGVRTWTVWVPERDRQSATLLEREGHELDAEPAAMAFELEQFDRGPAPAIELDEQPNVAELAMINDAAYGYNGDFSRALEDLPDDAVHLYIARVDGEPAACTGAFDHDRDCCIMLVATLAEARGRGLATELMTRALLEARERGCTTTSLQATKLGQPLYERLGYRDLGALQMWERRKT